VGDLDGDGKLELVANTRNGSLFAWKTEGRVDGRIDWGSFHHDLRNSGNFEAGPDFGRRASPGGCAVAAPVEASAGRGLALVLIGAAMILVVARRRRS
jgi:MYXO-CTERM domain-containing protein